MHFREWQILILDQDFIEIRLRLQINIKIATGCNGLMSLGSAPLSDPIVTPNYDITWRHEAGMSWDEIKHI